MVQMTTRILFMGAPILLAGIAQGLCIKYDWLKSLQRPLDLGGSLRGKRIFGDHKTWRGMVINVLFCMTGASMQAWLQAQGAVPPWVLLVDYQADGLVLGLLLGLGMTLGELPNSLLKRQLDISPGKSGMGPLRVVFFVFDQVDLVIGIWVFIFFLVRPTASLVLWSFVITLVLHVMVSVAGYFLGMRKTLV